MRAPLVLIALAATAAAQHHPRPLHARDADKPAANPEALPITRVALYKNGVGFFEHAGRVTGDESVTIDFTSAQLNDVLQTLTAIDLGGGRISGAGYNSTTPLDQQLKALPLALSDDPSDVDFYNAIRGARVQVSGPGVSIAGRLLSIDLRNTAKKDDSNSDTTGDRRFVTIVSDTGQVRTLELTAAISVTLLDTSLHTDVTRYLELLASTRNEGLRHLTLLDRSPAGASGARELRVSYISEVPVWKSTYRILFSNTAANAATEATLQGWSVVDNTTGSDWNNVHLDLIAGAPQSFIQPLSTPYYTRRPEIPLPSEAQLTPQTHDSGEVASEPVADAAPEQTSQSVTVSAVQVQSLAMAGRSLNAPKLKKADRFSGGGLAGIGVGSGSGMGGGYGGPIANYAEAAQASITPGTTTSAFDDFFEYSLTDPITIRKNESALVPILQTKLPIERVTLWSPQQPVALRALCLTNSSNLTLDRGSFSIVEGGSFGGEGLVDPIHPGEKRLLSYAADQAVRVTVDRNTNSRTIQRISIAKGVLTETSTDVNEFEYLVHNAAPEARTVIIEQPLYAGWTIDNAGAPGETAPKPVETTPTAARFRVAAQPRETVRLHIGEHHTSVEAIRLVDRTEEQLRLLVQGSKVSPAMLAALQPLFDLHHQVVELDRQIKARETEIAEIGKDQDRLRENMKALKGTPEERQLLQRYTGELNSQEDRLAALRTQLADLHTRRNATDAEFQQKMEAVSFDEML